MVRINSEHRNEQGENNGVRAERSFESMQKDYEEKQARNMRRIGGETVPNGDPPSLMLWGDE